MPQSFWGWSPRPVTGNSAARSRKNRLLGTRCPLFLELLEARNLLSGLQPTYTRVVLNGGANPFNGPSPTGTTVAQIRHAYGFDKISFKDSLGNTVPGDGSGTTIAIVDAFDNPTIANDLIQFDKAFNLPDPVFTKVDQTGGTNFPAVNNGWAGEIALDVEWAHAIAPKANILLVEATDNSYANLFAAVAYAAKQPGVVAVSMSFGGGEFSGQKVFDNTFKTPAGHTGVTFIASSGDNGAPASYPSSSPNVLSIGGTSLFTDALGNITAETGWGGSGGGISTIEIQPAYQKGVVTQSTTRRTNPDVAYDSDPNTGFPIYDTTNYPVSDPWEQFGGTSDAAPQWAALIAIADQGRALAGFPALDGATQTIPKIYTLAAADFNDILTGSSFGSPILAPGVGYDLVTGRGSPVADKVVNDLIGSNSGTNNPAATFSISAPASVVAGVPFNITVTALDATGQKALTYKGTIHFTNSDPLGFLPADYTFNRLTDKGTHTFTALATLKTAGTDQLIVTDTAVNSTITGSTTIIVKPAATTRLGFAVQPVNTAAGAVIPTVTVVAYDKYGNVVTTDNTDQVTISIGTNAGFPIVGTLGGTNTATVQAGIATFSNLTIDKTGNGYTLSATAPALSPTLSQPFNVIVAPAINAIEDFEKSDSWFVSGTDVNGYRTPTAAHDGSFGLVMTTGNDWIYRTDAAAQVSAGDTLSVWVQFSGTADGRAYFGFGSSQTGTLSLVAAADTNQLILQQNVNFGFKNLAVVNQTFKSDHWYRLEVDWGKAGAIVGKVFDSNGTTLLRSVNANTSGIKSGGVALRAIGSDKFFDTITATHGANYFGIIPHSTNPVSTVAGADLGPVAAGRFLSPQASLLLSGSTTATTFASSQATFTPTATTRAVDSTFASAPTATPASYRSSAADDSPPASGSGWADFSSTADPTSSADVDDLE